MAKAKVDWKRVAREAKVILEYMAYNVDLTEMESSWCREYSEKYKAALKRERAKKRGEG